MNSLILTTGTRAVFHTILLFSTFLLFAGHNAPGGGFIGGLVASAALVLRFVAHGPDDVRKTVRVAPETLLGVGVLLAAVAAVAPMLLGGELLSSDTLKVSVPLLGQVKASSVLVFDIGVYLVVVGLVLTMLHTLGGELDSGELDT